MKMGDPGYFEREVRHEQTTKNMRDTAKEMVAFEFAAEILRKEGVDIPEDFHYTSKEPELGMMLEKIGTIVAKAKNLTIDDASPRMRKAVVKDSKEVRDMNIGWEYFDNLCRKQKKRVLDSDVEHISYYSHYGKGIDTREIIEKIKKRETKSLTKGMDGR